MEWKLGQKKKLKEFVEDIERENITKRYQTSKKLIVLHSNTFYEFTPVYNDEIPYGSDLDPSEVEYEVSCIRSRSVNIY